MRKHWNNLFYCASCGYDTDHDGRTCPNPKQGHNPHIKHDEAHLYQGACMSSQHNMLPDGTGQGKGWLLAQAANKGFYTMAAQGQQPWAQVFLQQLQGQQGGGNRTSRNSGCNSRNRNYQGGGYGTSNRRVNWINNQGYGNTNGRVNWTTNQGYGEQWGS